MPVRLACLLRQDLVPGSLCVVQHERNKLHQRLFLLVAPSVRLAHCRRSRSSAGSQQRKKVLFKDDAQHQQDQRAANSQVHSAELKTPATATLVTAIFNVLAASARCPFHGNLPAALFAAKCYHDSMWLLVAA